MKKQKPNFESIIRFIKANGQDLHVLDNYVDQLELPEYLIFYAAPLPSSLLHTELGQWLSTATIVFPQTEVPDNMETFLLSAEKIKKLLSAIYCPQTFADNRLAILVMIECARFASENEVKKVYLRYWIDQKQSLLLQHNNLSQEGTAKRSIPALCPVINKPFSNDFNWELEASINKQGEMISGVARAGDFLDHLGNVDGNYTITDIINCPDQLLAFKTTENLKEDFEAKRHSFYTWQNGITVQLSGTRVHCSFDIAQSVTLSDRCRGKRCNEDDPNAELSIDNVLYTISFYVEQ